MREYIVKHYDKEDYDAYIENLTVDEVISKLAYIKRGYLPDYDFCGKENDYEHYKLQMVVSRAIDILSGVQK